MIINTVTRLSVVVGIIASAAIAHGAILTFDDVTAGATTYQGDGDGDNIVDVVFSTPWSGGFLSSGPGPKQNEIDAPGLNGFSVSPAKDLHVDFLFGAVDNLSFGFALLSPFEYGITDYGYADIEIYNSGDILLAYEKVAGEFKPFNSGQTSYPEGKVSVNFSGIASYAKLNLPSDVGPYSIDNFSGTFGSRERSASDVPEPATMLLIGTGLAGLAGTRLKRKKR